MTRTINNLGNSVRNCFSRKAILTVALAAMALAPAVTYAGRFDRGGDRGDRYRHDRDDSRARGESRSHTDVRVNINLARPPELCRWPAYEERATQVWVEPVYQTVTERVWVEPVYRTDCQRVWRDAVVRDECEQVWVPDRWELRTTVRGDGRFRTERTERVLVERGHYEMRNHRVVVSNGGWETVEHRVLVCDGHWETVQRQEVLSPGHWETRVERVAVDNGDRFGTVFGVFARFGR